MIGLILLFFSFYLYTKRKTRKYSILLFISFSYSGLRILTDSIIGIKNIDLAVVYTCVISLYSFFYEKQKISTPLDKWFRLLIIMVGACFVFSYFHYGFSFMQILQGGRGYLILFSFSFIKKQPNKDLEWIIKILFFLTCITAVLYVLQVVFKLPLLPYGETKIDPSTGILRMYNEPTFLVQFIYLTCFFPQYTRSIYGNSKLIRVIPIIFLTALILTQSRTFTFMSLAFLCVGLLLTGKIKRTLQLAILFSLLMIPLASILADRIEGGNTFQDLKSVYNGDYKKSANWGKGFDGTLSYRFAWVYERIEYLKNRPLSENLFGLGIISESQISTLNKLYKFRIGISDPETGHIQQIGTPDIIYGNFITSFGYLGAVVCIWFWIVTCKHLFKNRKSHPFVFSYSIYIMFCFIASFTGGYLIFKNLVMPFILVALIHNRKNNPKQQLNLMSYQIQ